MNLKYSLLTAERASAPGVERLGAVQGPAGNGSPCPPNNTAKRVYDAFLSFVGLVLLSPLFLLIALLVKLADGGPVFYRQKRIGQYGFPFFILKFRTMVPGAEKLGLSITSNGDWRITRVGRFLRKTKLDEVPQLWNVLCGEMSLVGPRPEVPRYVELYTPEQRVILRYKPGITDLASLRFREEESLLRAGEAAEQFYVEQCVPRKLQLNEEYARKANLLTDTWIILQTLCPYWVGVLGLYAFILAGSFWLSCALITNFHVTGRQFVQQLPLVTGLQLICLLARRQCRGLLCYFGLSELWEISMGLLQAALMLIAFYLVAGGGSLPRPNVILTNLCVSLVLLAEFRVLLRRWRERAESELPSADVPVRVGIIGAGSLGTQLARCLITQKHLGRVPVAFFDDDFAKWNKQIHEVPVVGMPECLLQGWCEKLDEIAIALPNASPERLQQIDQFVTRTGLKFYALEWPWPARTEAKPPRPE